MAVRLERLDRSKYFSSDFLNLIIMPTEACNFRCTYCYETFEHKKMPRRVVNGIKSLINRRGSGLSDLQIGWFGGEPNLAFDVITEISEHAISASKLYGFNFYGDMTTNGYFLDRKRFLDCLKNEIRFYQISLDGGPADHNLSRKLASGAGTFDRIWSNLIAMKDVPEDFAVTLRLHYNYENFLSVGDFAKRVNDTFGDDTRFDFFFRNISPLGGPNDSIITPISEQQREDIEAHLLNVSGLRPLPDSPDEDVCYAGKGNSIVVRSTGRLAKCTVALTQDFNDIGSIQEDGDLKIDQEKFRRWIAPVIEGRSEEVECPLSWVALQAALDTAAQVPPAPALTSIQSAPPLPA